MKNVCVVCGVEFDAKANAKTCGKDCSNQKKLEYRRKHYQENCEKVRERHRKHYQENREKVRERQRKHYQENCEKVRERHRKHYQENREKVREIMHKWYLKKTTSLQFFQSLAMADAIKSI